MWTLPSTLPTFEPAKQVVFSSEQSLGVLVVSPSHTRLSTMSMLLNLGSHPKTRAQLFTNSVIEVISVDSEIIFSKSLSWRSF